MGVSQRTTPLHHSAAVEAVRQTYADEIAKLKMQLLSYRAFIELHDLEPPDAEAEDLLRMWRNCEAVIRAAQNCIADMGTSAELLKGTWR
jgi:hypothetical protein